MSEILTNYVEDHSLIIKLRKTKNSIFKWATEKFLSAHFLYEKYCQFKHNGSLFNINVDDSLTLKHTKINILILIVII